MAKSKNIGSEIIEMHKNGHSYNKIAKELNVSKGTISYHCGEGQKEKSAKVRKKWRASHPKYRVLREWDANTTESKKLLIKHGNKIEVYKYKKNVEQKGLDKLTGRPLRSDKELHLDHWVPTAQGGSNEITNLAVLNPESNQAKSYMTEKEFVELCKDTLEFRGYIVKKANS